MRQIIFSCTTCGTQIEVRTDCPKEPVLGKDGSIIELFGYNPATEGFACSSRNGDWVPTSNCPACGMLIEKWEEKVI